jgi:gliding motility-associated-like protein
MTSFSNYLLNMGKFYYSSNLLRIKSMIRAIAVCLFFCFQTLSSSAQCPPNIDFEQGNFTGWQCAQARFVPPGVLSNYAVTGPIAGRHDIITAATLPALDQYGFFPKLCPNGSGSSIRIGLETTGTNADIVTYTFTIPAGQNEFSLIYNYALVINNAGGHAAAIQPRLEVSVVNITDNVTDTCSSDTLAYSNADPLPGFQDCSFNASIKFKPWAARSIKLDGHAGKTIEVTFRAIGCGASGGSHFGYAYVDINSECTSSFIGATFCPDDAFINVTGPFGYQTYEWWDQTFTTQLGLTQTINFTPPPPPGTVLKLVVVPYSGYGCTDTLTATLQDTLTIQAQAGPDRLSCNTTPVPLGVIPKPGYVYSWTPTAGLSDPNISNPIATVSVTTQYILTVTNAGGGCPSKDTVMVNASVIDNTLTLIGSAAFCPDGTQGAILQVLPADSIQWYLNNVAIPGATGTQHNVLQSGNYHATLFMNTGCSLSTLSRTITVYAMPDAVFSVNTTDQCLLNNQFVFTNSSTISSGSMQFDWDFGDANFSNLANPTHSYTAPGTYIVKLLATSNNGCKDSSFFTVNVFTMPVADFSINSIDQCFKDHQFVFTNNSSIAAGTISYEWDMGDGTKLTTTNASYSYTQPGTYIVTLKVTSDRNCIDTKSFTVRAFASPLTAFTVNKSEQCLLNNQFVFTNNSSVSSGSMGFTWEMGDGNIFPVPAPTHSYLQAGTYTVKLLGVTDNGCRDSSFFNVIVDPQPLAAFTVNAAEQCFTNNQFVFTNTSSILWGSMQYVWDLGDGTSVPGTNAIKSYTVPGDYMIKLIATSDKGCIDDSSFSVRNYPLAIADFDIARQPVCINAEVPIINKTINNIYNNIVYLWDFGNSQTASGRIPVYSYPAPGNYTIRLSVHLPICPLDITTKEMNMIIEAPVPGIKYPDKTAIFNFPEQLQARNVGTSVLWKPATSLDNRTSYSPVFKGITSQLYTIELKTPVGCVTVDTQFVHALRKVEIYVPTSFTPDNNGKNDLLRPLLYGFEKVNYFRIFDRWGKLLYEMRSDRPGWDGMKNGKPQEMQTLVWMIEAVDVDGKVHRKQGTTILLR